MMQPKMTIKIEYYFGFNKPVAVPMCCAVDAVNVRFQWDDCEFRFQNAITYEIEIDPFQYIVWIESGKSLAKFKLAHRIE